MCLFERYSLDMTAFMTKMASFCICDIMIHIYDIIDMHGNHGYNGHSFDFKKWCHKYMPDTCFGLLNTLSVAIYPPPLLEEQKRWFASKCTIWKQTEGLIFDRCIACTSQNWGCDAGKIYYMHLQIHSLHRFYGFLGLEGLILTKIQ